MDHRHAVHFVVFALLGAFVTSKPRAFQTAVISPADTEGKDVQDTVSDVALTRDDGSDIVDEQMPDELNGHSVVIHRRDADRDPKMNDPVGHSIDGTSSKSPEISHGDTGAIAGDTGVKIAGDQDGGRNIGTLIDGGGYANGTRSAETGGISRGTTDSITRGGVADGGGVTGGIVSGGFGDGSDGTGGIISGGGFGDSSDGTGGIISGGGFGDGSDGTGGIISGGFGDDYDGTGGIISGGIGDGSGGTGGIISGGVFGDSSNGTRGIISGGFGTGGSNDSTGNGGIISGKSNGNPFNIIGTDGWFGCANIYSRNSSRLISGDSGGGNGGFGDGTGVFDDGTGGFGDGTGGFGDVTGGFGDVTGGIGDGTGGFGDGTGGFGDGTGGFDDGTGGFGDGTGGFGDGTGGFGDVTGGIGDGTGGFGDGTGGFGDGTGGFDDGTGGVGDGTGGFGDGTGGFGDGTGGFGDGTGGFGDVTGGFDDGTGGVGDGTGAFGDGTGGFGDGTGGFGDGTGGFDDGTGGVGDETGAFGDWTGAFGDWTGAFGDWTSGFSNGIGGFGNTDIGGAYNETNAWLYLIEPIASHIPFSTVSLIALQLRYVSICQAGKQCQTPSHSETTSCCNCQCDEYCWDRRDCCPHVQYSPRETNNPHCLSSHMIRNEEPQAGHFFSVVDTCPDDAPLFRHQCEDGSINSQGPWLTDVTTGIIYKNKFCYYCNHGYNVVPTAFNELRPWTTKVYCPQIGVHARKKRAPISRGENEINDDLTANNTMVNYAYTELGCSFLMIPQDIGTDNVTRYSMCHNLTPDVTYISSCNVTGQWKVYNSPVESACDFFVNSYKPNTDEDIVYKSVYCYYCNIDIDATESIVDECTIWNQDLSTDTFISVDEIDVSGNPEIGVISFVEFQEQHEVNTGGGSGTSTGPTPPCESACFKYVRELCMQNELADPYISINNLKLCRPFICAVDELALSGKCVKSTAICIRDGQLESPAKCVSVQVYIYTDNPHRVWDVYYSSIAESCVDDYLRAGMLGCILMERTTMLLPPRNGTTVYSIHMVIRSEGRCSTQLIRETLDAFTILGRLSCNAYLDNETNIMSIQTMYARLSNENHGLPARTISKSTVINATCINMYQFTNLKCPSVALSRSDYEEMVSNHVLMANTDIKDYICPDKTDCPTLVCVDDYKNPMLGTGIQTPLPGYGLHDRSFIRNGGNPTHMMLSCFYAVFVIVSLTYY